MLQIAPEFTGANGNKKAPHRLQCGAEGIPHPRLTGLSAFWPVARFRVSNCQYIRGQPGESWAGVYSRLRLVVSMTYDAIERLSAATLPLR